MPQTFSESDLIFSFPDEWVVRKFDKTLAYRSLSGHGLKGVDFIALTPDGKLWLIEVKNYRPRFSNTREYRAHRPRPEGLAKKVGRKFTDTRRLLRIVNKALRSKWWFRVWLRYRRWLPGRKSSYRFWTEAHERSADDRKLVYVLWLETPEKSKDYGARVRGLLAERLAKSSTLYVVERERTESLPFQTLV